MYGSTPLGGKERRKVRRQKCSTITIEANKKHIKNHSNKELTNDQINLLAKGLKSIPTPVTKQTQIRQQLLRDFDQFERRMRLMYIHERLRPVQEFTAGICLACVAGVREGRERKLGRETPFPKTPFPFPFKRLPRRLAFARGVKIPRPCAFLAVRHMCRPRSGRPIVSGCDGPTEKLSSFVDKLLQPIAQQQKSYLKDTTDFVNFIENTKVPADVILVSMDVTSLYTNIPQEEGIDTVCRAYEIFYKNEPPIPTQLLKQALRLILQENSFQFN